MDMIKMTRPYMQFSQGATYTINRQDKANSIEIRYNGRTFDIPRSHCEITHISTPAPTPAPTGYSAPPITGKWIDPNAVTLSGLMGSDPVGTTAPVAPASPAPAPPVLSLRDNQVYMSHFTGGKLPESGIDRIVNMYPSDTWGEEHWGAIPDFDPMYHWNPNMLELLILGLEDSERVLFVGLPGTGKTTAHEQFAAIIGQPFQAINGKDGMEPSSYLGSVAPDGTGGWAWSDGVLPVCMRNGYYLCIDEVFKIAAGINMAMQSVWQRGGKLVLDDKPGNLLDKQVVPDPKFLLMATDNVKGLGDSFSMFAGTQMQDTSTLDRFDSTFTVPYMEELVEIDLLDRMYPTVQRNEIEALVKVAGLIRKGYATEEISLTLSMRGLTSTCRKITRQCKPWEAFRYAYLEKLADEQEIQAVEEFAKTCGLKEQSW